MELKKASHHFPSLLAKKKGKRKGAPRGKRGKSSKKKFPLLTISLLMVAGLFLLLAGNFNRVVDYVIEKQLPELQKQISYRNSKVSLSGKATLKEVAIHFSGAARGVQLQTPKLSVSFHLPSLMRSMFDEKATPRFSLIEMKEATLSWEGGNKMMREGNLTSAFRAIEKSRDLALLNGSSIAIQKLTLSPPTNWSPVLFSRLPPLENLSLKLRYRPDQKQLSFEQIKMKLYQGVVSGKAQLSLSGEENHLEAELQSLSLRQSGRLFLPQSISIEGTVSGKIRATTPPDRVWEPKAQGELMLSNVTLSGLALQKGEVVQKRAPQFEVISLDRVAVSPLTIDRRRLSWEMEGVGREFDCTAKGSGTTDGAFRMTMPMTIHPKAHAKLPWLTQTGLQATPEGGSRLTLQISGNLERQRLDNYDQLFKSGFKHGLRNTSRTLLNKFKR